MSSQSCAAVSADTRPACHHKYNCMNCDITFGGGTWDKKVDQVRGLKLRVALEGQHSVAVRQYLICRPG